MLGSDGLVRPLGREQVIWEIAHDFLARVLGQLPGRLRVSPWRRAFAYAAPVLAGVWLLTAAGVAALVLERDAATAVHKLVAMGFTIQDQGSEGLSIISGSLKPGAVDVLQSHYRDLPAISQLFIGGDRDLQLLRLPKNAETLCCLHVYGNERLVRIEDFAGLTKLKYLTISSNAALGEIKDLANLSELESLDISSNASLTTIDGLAGLTNLKTFTVMQNPILTQIKGLNSLSNLQSLMISGAALRSIEELASLSIIQQRMIDGPYASAAIAQCARLPALKTVQLESRPELREAAAQFQASRKEHKLPDVDFYFFPPLLKKGNLSCANRSGTVKSTISPSDSWILETPGGGGFGTCTP